MTPAVKANVKAKSAASAKTAPVPAAKPDLVGRPEKNEPDRATSSGTVESAGRDQELRRGGGTPLTRPASVTAVTVLSGVVAAAMVGYAIYLIIAGVTGQPDLRGRAEAVGVIFLLLGLGIGLVCRGLARLQPWSRTPAILTHLLLVGSAYRMFQDSLYVEGTLVGLYGLAGVVLLFVPASHRVLSRDVH
jgi:hypothetical protein